jgi:hypothetical protein
MADGQASQGRRPGAREIAQRQCAAAISFIYSSSWLTSLGRFCASFVNWTCVHAGFHLSSARHDTQTTMQKFVTIHSLYPAMTETVGALPCRQELANEARSDRVQALARRCAR